MTKTKRVGIAFPVHNRREITLQCLRSLARIDSEGLEVHVVMVDDGSTDGTSEAVENEFPEVEVIRGDGNFWFTESTNVGVRAALKHDPDYIVMMNDDQVFDSKFLKYLVETAEKYPRSIVGPLLLLWNEPHKLFQVSPRWETFSGGWRQWYHQTVWTVPKSCWEVEIIVGNCVLIPVEAITECGLMDSRRHLNCGDAEYTPRLRRKGWRLLIDPRARVFCQPNTVWERISKMTLREKFDKLFRDVGYVHNIRRRLRTSLDGAPSKIYGLVAFLIFYLQLPFGKNVDKSLDANEEKPLSEVYASKVVTK